MEKRFECFYASPGKIQAALKGILIAAAITILYFPVLKRLVGDWINLPDFSHGFLIPLISLYILYDKRKSFSRIMPLGCWSGLVWVVVGILLLILGELALEYFTMRFSLLFVISGCILLLLGKEYFRMVRFPIFYLIFMVPIPTLLLDKMTFPMQLLASRFSAAALYAMGIPVLQEGNILELANTSLEVAEACSGIRSLISLIALSVVFAYLTQETTIRRVILIISTFPIAIVANVFRIAGTGLLANCYGNVAAQGFFHVFSGWVLFLVALGCFMGIGHILNRFKKIKT